MKIVFSRKGFDSGSGGGASPIVDGKPISLPIPDTKGIARTTYGDLGLGEHASKASKGAYGPESQCHHDPMFTGDGRCLFGQVGAAQTHLANQGVGVGDTFLFFGLFRRDGEAPHHRIFGYLKIEEMISLADSVPDDLVALGAAAPVSFIAKHEVAGWPGVSVLAKLQETLFIERAKRGKAGEQAEKIRQRLADGDVMVLFAEGTTSDGNSLLPFKSALFGAVGVRAGNEESASREPVHVQPVAIVYTHHHGIPMGRYGRPLAAWPGDVELGPHVAGVIGAGAIDVSILFGNPIVATDMPDRKALALACETAIRDMASSALRGRFPPSHGR